MKIELIRALFNHIAIIVEIKNIHDVFERLVFKLLIN